MSVTKTKNILRNCLRLLPRKSLDEFATSYGATDRPWHFERGALEHAITGKDCEELRGEIADWINHRLMAGFEKNEAPAIRQGSKANA